MKTLSKSLKCIIYFNNVKDQKIYAKKNLPQENYKWGVFFHPWVLPLGIGKVSIKILGRETNQIKKENSSVWGNIPKKLYENG